MALGSSFQPLSNSCYGNPICASRIRYSEILAGDQIKYCRTVACNLSKDNLDYICISYLISQSTPRFQILILYAC